VSPNENAGFRLRSLEQENRQLRRAIEELTVINDLARAIGASLNSQDVMSTIISRSLRAVGAEQGVITLVDEKASQPMKTLVRTMVSSSEHPTYHLDQCILGWMHLYKKPLLVNDPPNDDRFQGVRWEESIRSLLCVPLLVKSELKGILTVCNKKGGGGFTEEDQRLLAIIAAQSAQVVENARLYEEEQDLIRMKEEVRVASEIQMRLPPKSSPRIAGYDIAGTSIPAEVVGGDYFDFIPIEDERLAICLGDVSGKGLPAALLMANLQATIRGQALSTMSPGECTGRSNTLLFQSTDTEKFATLFYGVLDARDGRLRYCNAGHEKPFLFSEEEAAVRLEAGGLVLSFVEQFPYEEGTVSFGPGSVLVVFSDGITDAANRDGEPYGEDRLAGVIRRNRGQPAAVLVERIVADVLEHAGDCPQTDDMTLVVIRNCKSPDAGPTDRS